MSCITEWQQEAEAFLQDIRLQKDILNKAKKKTADPALQAKKAEAEERLRAAAPEEREAAEEELNSIEYDIAELYDKYELKLEQVQTMESAKTLTDYILGLPLQSPASALPGDLVCFGRYWYTSAVRKAPCVWRVLEREGDTLLLVSEFAIDYRMFHEFYEDIDDNVVWKSTWAESTTRRFLNNSFVSAAFSPEEQKQLLTSSIANNANPVYGIDGGQNTEDRVFCLSIEEAERYFESDRDRLCLPTPYSLYHNLSVFNEKYGINDEEDRKNGLDWCPYFVETGEEGGVRWWLRSPVPSEYGAAFVKMNGAIDKYGLAPEEHHSDNLLMSGIVYDDSFAYLRPAVRIRINKDEKNEEING